MALILFNRQKCWQQGLISGMSQCLTEKNEMSCDEHLAQSLSHKYLFKQ